MYRITPKRTFPPLWRVIVGFIVVPALAAFVLAYFMPAYDGLTNATERVLRTAIMYALFGAYPPTILIGIPAYFALRNRFDLNLLNCSMVGAALAALPWILISLVSSPDQASTDGRPTVVAGSMTAFGWLSLAQFVGQIAVFGALGGGFFWAIVAAGSGTGKVSND
ncbi:hypothetical protein EUV02_15515 [Polymorphobacter arshaanensis]|uniref:Uncharacterized protein n=1 Tax=Glacieibacterium arshaanense TaxID=2511025 RepID=A0A4Y9EKD6_9SPHN|nr:hypothetical protein [Polymorphobacter arshaanensis]TFU00054.1 hypothetical protein EUV02_15515 [Polymorphobacter arshaanensis]